MDTPYRVVRLQRNHLYPTYQLFAHMASKKTTPQDGLRLAALTTMEWLRLRLGVRGTDLYRRGKRLVLPSA